MAKPLFCLFCHVPFCNKKMKSAYSLKLFTCIYCHRKNSYPVIRTKKRSKSKSDNSLLRATISHIIASSQAERSKPATASFTRRKSI